MKTKDSDPEFIVTVTLIVADISRSVSFYRDVLGATVLREGEPTFLRLANVSITINGGGGPTDDKPEVIASAPRDLSTLSSFLNLRVVDIKRCYELWLSRGARFITEPKVTNGDALLHARSGRISDRSRSNYDHRYAP
jgi:lactoylglutathione lyase